MDISVLHAIPPGSRDVKVLYDVFSWGREALAEYLYFGEIDAKAVKDDGTGDLSRADYHASVEVSFEEDTLDVARDDLASCSSFAGPPAIDALRNTTPETFFEGIDSDYTYRIGCHDNACSLMVVVHWTRSVIFRTWSIMEDRVTEITVTGKGNQITIGEMYKRFSELNEKYRSIPYRKFTGAIRE